MIHRPGSNDAATAPHDVCGDCSGELILGAVSLGLLSSPKFTYKLKAVEVSVPLKAWLCTNCGRVAFRADDPSPIVKAHTAMEATQLSRPTRAVRLRRPS